MMAVPDGDILESGSPGYATHTVLLLVNSRIP